MSGYLMRLIRRTRAAEAGQLMQPFVRSTSPVAEWDQRIGMMDVEGMEFGESSLTKGASETGLEQDDALQAPRLSSITAASAPEGVTVAEPLEPRPIEASTPPTGAGESRVSSLVGSTPGTGSLWNS